MLLMNGVGCWTEEGRVMGRVGEQSVTSGDVGHRSSCWRLLPPAQTYWRAVEVFIQRIQYKPLNSRKQNSNYNLHTTVSVQPILNPRKCNSNLVLHSRKRNSNSNEHGGKKDFPPLLLPQHTIILLSRKQQRLQHQRNNIIYYYAFQTMVARVSYLTMQIEESAVSAATPRVIFHIYR